MQAWAVGMSSATRRRVRIINQEGVDLLTVGEGEGEPSSFALAVNGQPVGRLELQPALDNPQLEASVINAIDTFAALAEVRNSMADMVKATARQWRELSLLYRSADLLRVDQEQGALASNLLREAMRALRSRLGVVLHGAEGETPPVKVSSGPEARVLDDVAEWGMGLKEGVIVSDADELERLGYSGASLDQPTLVVPLASRDRRFGSLVLVGPEGRPPTAEDLKLASLLADQAGRAFDNLQLVDRVRDAERLKRELELASEIQSSILPPADLTTDWYDFAGACVPAKWVGGDAFLFDEQKPDVILTGVADVCGHGISSALLMNAFASSIYAMSMTHAEPGRLLEVTNDLLSDRVEATGLFVTAILLRLRADGELTVASAGHPEALVVSASGEVESVECGDLPLGILAGGEYCETTRSLDPGSTVVAYSDGVTEARSPNGEMYGTDRLMALLERVAPAATGSAEIRAAVLEDVRKYRGGCEQDDDVTVVALRRTK